MTNIQQALKIAQASFVNSKTPVLDAELLLAHILNCERTSLHTWPEKEVAMVELQKYQQICAQRANGVPIAYLLGNQAFWKFNLQVTPDVLIPRPETELIVEVALKILSNHSMATVVDLGTGSGAIALALAYEHPNWKIIATDNSLKALKIAKANAKNLKINSIQWVKSHWLSELKDQCFDLIISNPPYIAPEDPHLVALGYEPKSALIAEKYGTADLENIIKAAPKHLLQNGYLLLEHGYQQAELVQELMLTAGFVNIETQLDLASHPRVTWGRWC